MSTLVRIAGTVALILLAGSQAAAQLPGSNVANFRAAGMDVTVRFRDERLRQMETQVRPVLTGALERYTELFGGRPRGSDGQPLSQLTVLVQADQLGGGDADPGVVHLLLSRQPVFGFYDWRMTLLHELFHLWSAESFAPAGAAEQWFNEGAAEFYALQTAARLQISDDVTTIRNAGTMVGFYASALGQDRMSLAEAGQQKERHHFLVYHGGFTAALVLDRSIRGASGNARSLDNLMPWLFANHDRDARRYTVMDLARGLRDAAGFDAAELFARSIMGRLPLSPAPVLNLGELARNLQAGRAGMRDLPAPDPLLLASLGLGTRR
jgi:predicted metalloprotease with PDZ domain